MGDKPKGFWRVSEKQDGNGVTHTRKFPFNKKVKYGSFEIKHTYLQANQSELKLKDYMVDVFH